MDRRLPTLADRFLSHRGGPALVAQRTYDQVKRRLRDAHRFVLDAQATVRLGEVSRDLPELIAKHQQFARAPYDITWIEFPLPVLFQTVTGEESSPTSDLTIGFLIDHGTTYTICGGTIKNPNAAPILTPVHYTLHTPWEPDEQERFAKSIGETREDARIQSALYAWGAVYNKLSEADRYALSEAHTPRILPTKYSDRVIWQKNALGSAQGELRTLTALLLMMNRPSLTQYIRELPRSRGFSFGKMMPFMSHTVVTITVDPRPVLRAIGTPVDSGIERRRHEVRGHYCHDIVYRRGTLRGCIHEWVADDDHQPPNHLHCAICTGKRWWRNTHHRGSSQVGFVDKEYSIT